MDVASMRRAVGKPALVAANAGRWSARWARRLVTFVCHGLMYAATRPALAWWWFMKACWRYQSRHVWVKVAIAEIITGPTLWYALSGSVVAQWIFAAWFCVLVCVVAYVFSGPVVTRTDVAVVPLTGFEGVDTVDASDTLESATAPLVCHPPEAECHAEASADAKETETGSSSDSSR